LSRTLQTIHRVEDGLLAVFLGAMIVLGSAQIVLRNLFHTGVSWGDPLLRVLVLWLGMLGALAASRDNQHITIDILSRVLPPRARSVARAVTSLFTAAVATLVSYHAGRFVVMDFQARSVAFAGLPAWVFEAVTPFAFGLIALRYLLLFARNARISLTGEA
jgi:TRAP-type C4-dicarboxylate transport system permease small subunit